MTVTVLASVIVTVLAFGRSVIAVPVDGLALLVVLAMVSE